MKPEHLDWIDRIWAILNASATNVMSDGVKLRKQKIKPREHKLREEK